MNDTVHAESFHEPATYSRRLDKCTAILASVSSILGHPYEMTFFPSSQLMFRHANVISISHNHATTTKTDRVSRSTKTSLPTIEPPQTPPKPLYYTLLYIPSTYIMRPASSTPQPSHRQSKCPRRRLPPQISVHHPLPPLLHLQPPSPRPHPPHPPQPPNPDLPTTTH